MSLRLLLIRHAKSSWEEPNLDDHQRPLAPRGTQAAARMGDHYQALLQSVEHFYCSSALRATQTLHLMLATPISPASVSIDDTWYTFNENQLLSQIRSLEESQKTVSILGHNPTLTELTNRLTEVKIDNLPTASFALIQFNHANWNSITNNCGKLLLFATPKSLTNR